MKNVKKDGNIIPGNYYVSAEEPMNWKAIFRAVTEGYLQDDNNYRTKALYITFNSEAPNSRCLSNPARANICYKSSARDFRSATPEEICWLDECIKRQEFVLKDDVPASKDVVNNSYSIF